MSYGPFPKNPYKGPRSFKKGERLYGRERELRALFYLLAAERIVLFHAPSGAGKTSLIQAALIDQLEAAGFHVLPIMRVGAELPRDRVLVLADGQQRDRAPANRYVWSAIQALEEPLQPAARAPLPTLDRLTFSEYLRQRPGAVDEHTHEVLIFDQFEEILTVEPNDRADKERFFGELGDALRDPRRWALFALREEYLGALDPYTHFMPGNLDRRFRLDLLEQRAAQAAMRQPARDAGVDFTIKAAEDLANNLRTVHIQRQDGTTESQLGTYIEPVQLQVVCLQLWDALAARPRHDLLDELLARRIGPEDLGTIGDVDHALANYYDEHVRAVVATGVQERFLRDWFDRWLITSDGLRSQVLRRIPETEKLPDRALAMLIDAHLIREEIRLGGKWCELTHDRLIGPIKESNQAWLESHLHPLQVQAALWIRQGEPNSLLFRDDALDDAIGWSETNPDQLTQEERRFVDASQAEQDQIEKRLQEQQRERQNARRLRTLSFATGALGILCTVLIGYIFFPLYRDQNIKDQSVARTNDKANAQATVQLASNHGATAQSVGTQTYVQSTLGNPTIESTAIASQQTATVAAEQVAQAQATIAEVDRQNLTAEPTLVALNANDAYAQVQIAQVEAIRVNSEATATAYARSAQEAMATATVLVSTVLELQATSTAVAATVRPIEPTKIVISETPPNQTNQSIINGSPSPGETTNPTMPITTTTALPTSTSSAALSTTVTVSATAIVSTTTESTPAIAAPTATTGSPTSVSAATGGPTAVRAPTAVPSETPMAAPTAQTSAAIPAATAIPTEVQGPIATPTPKT
jgi:hypothetical protein